LMVENACLAGQAGKMSNCEELYIFDMTFEIIN